MLSQMGFPPCCLQWRKECINTPTFSVLVNGAPNCCFKSKRGLWQGDPNSPYLFCLAMEVLTVTVEEGLHAKLWESYTIKYTRMVSHHLFADDILLFAKPRQKSIRGLNTILNKFGMESGLTVNMGKIFLYFAKSVDNGDTLSSISGIQKGNSPCALSRDPS